MSQYKVVKATGSHEFKVGEIVTRAGEDSQEFQQFRMIAAIFGADKDPRFLASAPYNNADGMTQVLEDDEVEPV